MIRDARSGDCVDVGTAGDPGPVRSRWRAPRPGWWAMDKIRIMVILGTRPEAIKLLPVIQAIRDSEWFAPMVVTTGQHGDVVQEILDLADIEPTVKLSVGRPDI